MALVEAQEREALLIGIPMAMIFKDEGRDHHRGGVGREATEVQAVGIMDGACPTSCGTRTLRF